MVSPFQKGSFEEGALLPESPSLRRVRKKGEQEGEVSE